MGRVNFYLKKAEPTTGKCLIYLKYKYNKQVLVWTFGQSVKETDWDAARQRVKDKKATTANGDYLLNDTLDKLGEVLQAAHKAELVNGQPDPTTLKKHLNAFWNRNTKGDDTPTFYKLLDRFISGEIKHKGKEKSPNTIKTYNTLRGHLVAFERVRKYGVDFDTINLDFLYKYITFLRSKFTEADVRGIQDEKIKKSLLSLPVGQNAIAKDVQIIKTVMKKAVTMGQTTNLQHEHEDFTAVREESDSVYLTDREILKLYRHDFSNNKRYQAIRDLFVFGCYVGLRYSDYSTVKPENIVEIENERGEKKLFIKMITKKTGSLVIIPCSPVVLEIFDRYQHNPNKLPKAYSNQKFNTLIKEVCKEAGFTEKGRLSTNPDLELWQAVSSHTARRSMITNTYLSGFPVQDLMKISTHTTEKAFMKYLKVSKLDAAKRLDTHMGKVWGSYLKAV